MATKRKFVRKVQLAPVEEQDETIVSVKKNSKTTKLEVKNSIPESVGEFVSNLFRKET